MKSCSYCEKLVGSLTKGLCQPCYDRQRKTGSPEPKVLAKSLPCSFCGKEGKTVAKGLCNACYYRQKKRGTLEYRVAKRETPCTNCGALPTVARGWCDKCYCRWKAHGDVTKGKPDRWGEAQHHPLQKLWSGMIQRCNSETSKYYKNYGARGIKVCDRWHTFWNFVDDMGERPSPKHSIERINNDGNYEPGNCKWATAVEQQRNKRNIVLSLELAAEIRRRLAFGDSVSAIARALKLPYDNVHNVKVFDIWK